MSSEQPPPAPELPRPIAEAEELLLPTPPSSPRREFFTFVIALSLVLAFVLIVGVPALVWTIWNVPGASVDEIVKLVTTVSSIMAGLVGAVAGYYFRVREEATRRGEG